MLHCFQVYDVGLRRLHAWEVITTVSVVSLGHAHGCDVFDCFPGGLLVPAAHLSYSWNLVPPAPFHLFTHRAALRSGNRQWVLLLFPPLGQPLMSSQVARRQTERENSGGLD